jgi:hypothetical protein
VNDARKCSFRPGKFLFAQAKPPSESPPSIEGDSEGELAWDSMRHPEDEIHQAQ